MFVQQYVAFLDNFCQFESFYDLDFLHLVLYYFKACKEFFMVVKIACF